MNRHAQALRHFSYLTKIKPHWASAFYGACLAAFKIGKFDQALENIERAIALTAATDEEEGRCKGVTQKEIKGHTIRRDSDRKQGLA